MQTGEVLDDKYEILERLGAGGMGEVYKATHRYLGTIRVIKVIRPHVSGSSDAKERFLREARAATKVHHPNVATLHDFSRLPDGSHYMVWEYIDGENLAQRLRSRGTLPPEQALSIAIQALHGLDAIHRAGIVHRDISPENLMITRDGDAMKIIDLGVAKLEDAGWSVVQTQTGIFVGKLRYASPEQLGFLPEGEKLDGRADLYAMAMVIVEMLTGRPPYEAKSPQEYFIFHAREPQKRTVELPPSLPASAALQKILEKALARDRNRRWATAGEFAAALEEVKRAGLQPARTAPTSAAEAQATMRIPPPAARELRAPTEPSSAAPTVRTPLPAALPLATEAPRRKTRGLWIAASVTIIALAAAGTMRFWPRPSQPPAVDQTRAVTKTGVPSATTMTVAGPETAESTIVTESAAGPALETAPSASQSVAPAGAPPPAVAAVPEETKPVPVAPPMKTPPTAAKPTSSAAVEVGTYIDGGGDGDVNERAVEYLGSQIQGVTSIEVHAGAMQQELVNRLKEDVEHLQVVDSASVVIRFDGVLERLGRGRKKRSAQATITKDGRVVFRYQLPELVYRVGMTPAEAFTRVISDAFVE